LRFVGDAWVPADGRACTPNGQAMTETQYWGRLRGFARSYPALAVHLQSIDDALLLGGSSPLPCGPHIAN